MVQVPDPDQGRSFSEHREFSKPQSQNMVFALLSFFKHIHA